MKYFMKKFHSLVSSLKMLYFNLYQFKEQGGLKSSFQNYIVYASQYFVKHRGKNMFFLTLLR